MVAISDKKLGMIIREALGAHGYVLRQAKPDAIRGAIPWRLDSAKHDAASAKASGITVERLHGRRAWMERKGQLEPCDDDGSPGCAEWMAGWAEMEAVRQQFPSGERCHASRDGEVCNFRSWQSCPQERDNESMKSGRHCPLDREWDDEEA